MESRPARPELNQKLLQSSEANIPRGRVAPKMKNHLLSS
jgi:hypothetical protein